MRSSEVRGEPSGSCHSVPRRIPEWGIGQTGAKSPNHQFYCSRRPARGPAPSPVRAGNEWTASVLQKSPPPLPRPRSHSAAALAGRGASGSRSKQTREHRPSPSRRGALTPNSGEGWEAQLVQDPVTALGLRTPAPDRGRGPFHPVGRSGSDARPRGSLPRLYLLFHVPQQFLFDCVLRAAHGAAGGRESEPSGPLSPPRALAASAPLGSAPHAQGGDLARGAPRPPPSPQPLPVARLRSHLPSPAQTSGSWPGPFPQTGAGGALSDPGLPPGRAPRGPLSWQRAGFSPQGANPHCERLQSGLYYDPRGDEARPGPCGWLRTKLLARKLASIQLDAPLISTRSFSRREGPGALCASILPRGKTVVLWLKGRSSIVSLSPLPTVAGCW